MAAVLLRLRLAIQRSGRGRSADAQGALFWAVWVLAGVAGLGGGALVAFLTGLDDGTALVLMVFVGLFLGWVLLPITVPALQDQTVDPARLEMFPITTGQKVGGLLLGGLVAPTALFTFLTASGGALAPDEPLAVRVAVPVVSALFVVLCVACSRAVQALLSRASSTRRGRDAALVATGLISIGGYLAIRYLASNADALAVFSSSTLATVLEWTPPGAAGQINLDMRAQDWADAVGGLAFVLAWVAVALGGWYWALSRRERGGGHASVRRAKAGRQAGSLALTGGIMRAFAPSAALASAAQYAHYLFFRNPRASQQVLISLIVAAFLGHTSGMPSGLAVAAGLYGGFATISMATGMLNYDGRGAQFLVVAGAPLRSVLAGKFAVTATVVSLATVVFMVVEAALGGFWGVAFESVLFGVAAVVWASAVGAYVSVVSPFDSEHKAPGRGRALVAILVALGVVLGAVIAVAGLLSLLPTPLLVNAILAVAVSAAASWAVLRRAGAHFQGHQLEIAEAVAVS
ncbi:hypothetical protein [Demequina sp. NBRC 110056]|uniref:hypothetical protein n=1 Tax=Demequina sp. NBRC 110056 TaxID=1570345 RepID=UPI0009FF1A6B|nr:hypothetical protein [Demequina sp. NBRC 110056]